MLRKLSLHFPEFDLAVTTLVSDPTEICSSHDIPVKARNFSDSQSQNIFQVASTLPSFLALHRFPELKMGAANLSAILGSAQVLVHWLKESQLSMFWGEDQQSQTTLPVLETSCIRSIIREVSSLKVSRGL
jgi:hypothetical protein